MRCLTNCAGSWRSPAPSRPAGRRSHDEPARPPTLARAGVAGLDRGGRRARAASLGTATCLLGVADRDEGQERSEEHTSELQSLMRTSYAVFCLKKKKHYIR